ncbi:dual specificity protein phosphatase 1B isoform X1 [Mangifera indica]|uniref:dual specificity protein phosphatase 1B isoform X1 n=1 Tax=Mangifera indica TaxID=29780 RepID=UPI001CFBDBAD|nr:dual specificity protein phosphatase 1B isoform X1 [Mangifera indica]
MWQLNAARYFEKNNVLCQIEEGLFLGSIGDANNKDALKSSNVTHVLTVANLGKPPFPNDFVYKVVEVMDREDTNLMLYFDECFNFIDEAKRLGGGVLVHCFMGISRSVTIVVAYLMKKHGMRLSQALAHVKCRRPQAAPNYGFISQLQQFEQNLQGASNSLLQS